MTRFRTLAILPMLALAGAPPSVGADACGPGTGPGATLLIPYFEVDLADPGGRTTLFSVGNAGAEPTVARVILWTNMGAVTLAFEIVLDAGEVQTMNLRDLMRVQVPQIDAGDAEVFERCAGWLPFYGPPDPWTLTDLRVSHTGQPHPGHGFCRGWPTGDPDLAVGYVTVDAMNDCTPLYVHPFDLGALPPDRPYFDHGGTGLASNRNVLWGDVFHVDPSGASAQGIAAVALRAGADRFGPDDTTFYAQACQSLCAADGREPLPSTYRARFLVGGPFEAATDLIVWLDPRNTIDGGYLDGFSPGFPCGDRTLQDPWGEVCERVTIRLFDERGNQLGEPTVLVDEELFPAVRRLRVGDDLPASASAGYLELRREKFPGCERRGPLTPIPVPGLPQPPRDWIPWQAWAAPVIRAEGRYSLSHGAQPLDSLCPEPAPAAP